MSTARLLSASTPVSPTTAAIAPNAPIGAAHMIIASTRNTSRCRCPIAAQDRLAGAPIACSAKPTSSATSRVCSTSPDGQRREQRGRDDAEQEVRRAAVPSAACSWPAPATASSVRCSPRPGGGCCRPPGRWRGRTSTSSGSSRAPGRRPCRPARRCATEPTPSTIVQKMTGWIIILIRSTNAVPSGLSSTAKSGATKPTRDAEDDGARSRRCTGSGCGLGVAPVGRGRWPWSSRSGSGVRPAGVPHRRADL